jgi:hypothetical protein
VRTRAPRKGPGAIAGAWAFKLAPAAPAAASFMISRLVMRISHCRPRSKLKRSTTWPLGRSGIEAVNESEPAAQAARIRSGLAVGFQMKEPNIVRLNALKNSPRKLNVTPFPDTGNSPKLELPSGWRCWR